MVRPAWEEEAASKLFVAIPSKGPVDVGWALTLAEILRQSPLPYGTMASSAPAVDFARNGLVESFLSSPCTWSLWLDTDVIPPTDIIPRLLHHNLPIMSGFYRSRNVGFASQTDWPIVAGMFDKDGRVMEVLRWNVGDVLKVDAVGMGCVLIHRKVFEAIAPPWFDFTLKYKYVGQDVYTHDSVPVSEDWYFFHKVKKTGFPVYVDTNAPCMHQTLANIGYDGMVYTGGLK